MWPGLWPAVLRKGCPAEPPSGLHQARSSWPPAAKEAARSKRPRLVHRLPLQPPTPDLANLLHHFQCCQWAAGGAGPRMGWCSWGWLQCLPVKPELLSQYTEGTFSPGISARPAGSGLAACSRPLSFSHAQEGELRALAPRRFRGSIHEPSGCFLLLTAAREELGQSSCGARPQPGPHKRLTAEGGRGYSSTCPSAWNTPPSRWVKTLRIHDSSPVGYPGRKMC